VGGMQEIVGRLFFHAGSSVKAKGGWSFSINTPNVPNLPVWILFMIKCFMANYQDLVILSIFSLGGIALLIICFLLWKNS